MASDAEIKKIWEKIKAAPAAEKEQIINSLDPKILNKLRVVGNPYKKPVFSNDKPKYLLFSLINMQEKYLARFQMTSLVGFLYRMLHEYEPTDMDKYKSENDLEFSKEYNQLVKEYVKNKPLELMTTDFDELTEKIKKLEAELTKGNSRSTESTKDNSDESSETKGNSSKLSLVKDNSNKSALTSEYKALVKESFMLRSKIFRYKIYTAREEHDAMRMEEMAVTKARENAEIEFKDIKDKHALLKSRMTIKKKIKELTDKGESAEKYEKELSKEELSKDISLWEDLAQTGDRAITQCEKKVNDAKKQELIMQSKTAPLLEQVKRNTELYHKLKDEYNKVILHLKGKYMDKTHPLDEADIDKYSPDGKVLDEIAKKVKEKLGIEKTAEEYKEERQVIIEDFLNQYLRYNPDNHVSCAYRPNYNDPERTPLEKTQERDEKQKLYERTLVPPNDTFFRFRRYQDEHYEELRQATDDIYQEKSLLENAIIPIEVVEASNEDDAKNQIRNFTQKYRSEFDCEILSAKFVNWNCRIMARRDLSHHGNKTETFVISLLRIQKLLNVLLTNLRMMYVWVKN